MKRWTNRDHQFDPLGNCRQCRGPGPRVKRWRLDTFDVVEDQFRNQRHVKTDFLAALRQLFHLAPTGLHVFVRNVAQPAAKTGKPVSVPHRATSRVTSRVTSLVILFSERAAPRDAASCRTASAIRYSARRA